MILNDLEIKTYKNTKFESKSEINSMYVGYVL